MRYDAALAHVRCEWDGHTFTCAENEMDRDEVHAANSLAVCLQMGRRPLYRPPAQDGMQYALRPVAGAVAGDAR